MLTDDFDFILPPECVALRPVRPRDAARMLVVNAKGELLHSHVSKLPQFLNRGDALALNDTVVYPARLYGRREQRLGGRGTRVEFLLHKRLAIDCYQAFVKPARRLSRGDTIDFGEGLRGRVGIDPTDGEIEIRFNQSGEALDVLIEALGELPLPPYIRSKREVDIFDADDYQTSFGSNRGSVAAPTAGLHFTSSLFAQLDVVGVSREMLTLHVGPGTFLPVRVDELSQHRMHPEWANLSAATADRLNATRSRGGRIIAVGSTSLRTLESAAEPDGRLRSFEGETDIFIQPGYRFRTAEILLTNFHLPRSTLFMLISAFCGLNVMKAAYAEAIQQHYRFYSYGDACLLFRSPQ